MSYFSKSVQLAPLEYSVVEASSEMQVGSRNNVINDSSAWTMRWTPAEHDDTPSILLCLRKPAIVHSISFGKFSRPVGDNARDITVLGGWHSDALTPLLNCRLRNSASVQTFSLTSSVTADDFDWHCKAKNAYSVSSSSTSTSTSSSNSTVCVATVHRVPFAIRFLRIVVRSSWSLKSNASLWHVALHGDSNVAFIRRARRAIDRFVAGRQLRQSLALLRRRGAVAAFDAMLAGGAMGDIRLEHPLITALFRAAIDAPTPLHVASVLEPLLAHDDMRRLFDERALGEPPTSARWRRVPMSQPWPTARGGHQLCFDRATGRNYLFGGWTGTNDLGDLWYYDLASQRWTMLKPLDGEGPSPRSCHKVAFDPVRRRIYTLGRYVEPPLEAARPVSAHDDEEVFLPWSRRAVGEEMAEVGDRHAQRPLRYRNYAARPWSGYRASAGTQANNSSSASLQEALLDMVAGSSGTASTVSAIVNAAWRRTSANDDDEAEHELDDDEGYEVAGAAVDDDNDVGGGSNVNDAASSGSSLSLAAASLMTEFDEAALSIVRDMWQHGVFGNRGNESQQDQQQQSTDVDATGASATESGAESGNRRTRTLLSAVDFVGLLALLATRLPDDLLEQLERHMGGQLALDESAESGVALDRTRVEEADFWYYSLDENRWHCISRDTAADGGPPLIYDQQMCCSDDGRLIYVFGGRCVDERARNVTARERLSVAALQQAIDAVTAAHNGEAPTTSASSTAAAPAPAPSGSASPRLTTVMSVRARLAVRPRRPLTETNYDSSSSHTYCGLYTYTIDENKWTLLVGDEADTLLPSSVPRNDDVATTSNSLADDTEMYGDVPLRARIGHSMSLFENKLHILGGQRESEYLADHIVFDMKRMCVARLHRDSSLLGGPGAGFTQRASLNRKHAEIHVLSGLVRPTHAARELVRNSLWVYSIPRDRWSLVVADGDRVSASNECSLEDMLGSSSNGEQQSSDSRHSFVQQQAAPHFDVEYGAPAPAPAARSASDRPAPRYAHQWVSDDSTHYLFGGNPGWARPRNTSRLDDLWELKLERTDGATYGARALFLTRQFHFERLCDAAERARACNADCARATEQALAYLQSDVFVSVNGMANKADDFQRLASRLLLGSTISEDEEESQTRDIRTRVQLVENICRLLPSTSIAPLE